MNFCYKCTHETIGEVSSGTDWFTIIIALATVGVTIYVVYLGKKVEIKISRFNKLCFDPLELKFNFLADLIQEHKTEQISNHLNAITEISTDFNLVLTQIKHVYPKLDIDKLQDIFQEFTDKAFANQQEGMYSIFGDFLGIKVRILNKVYDYALISELKVLKFR
ncbi:MAG: hypothetical protein H0W84_01335 [Bacteroidetes bacterium]|nr:hypothetical protein [Bacteroidota bacterium]